MAALSDSSNSAGGISGLELGSELASSNYHSSSMFTIKFGIAILYGTITFVLYTMTIFMLRKNWKDYSGTFFKLYVAFYFFNLLTFCNSFITLRIPQNTCKDCLMSFLFKDQQPNTTSWFPLNVFFAIHYSMAYVQYGMIMFMSINRCSMIFLLTGYEKFWKRAFPLVILFLIIYPIILTSPILLGNAWYVYTPSLDCYTTKSSADIEAVYNPLLLYMIIATTTTASVNIMSFCRLNCITSKISAAERNLLFVSGASFLVQFVAFVNTLINRMVVSDSNRNTIWAQIAQQVVPFVSDGLTLIHPWTLLIFSGKARNSFYRMYYPKLYRPSAANTMIFTSQVAKVSRF